jgi:hypothetical protein
MTAVRSARARRSPERRAARGRRDLPARPCAQLSGLRPQSIHAPCPFHERPGRPCSQFHAVFRATSTRNPAAPCVLQYSRPASCSPAAGPRAAGAPGPARSTGTPGHARQAHRPALPARSKACPSACRLPPGTEALSKSVPEGRLLRRPQELGFVRLIWLPARPTRIPVQRFATEGLGVSSD